MTPPGDSAALAHAAESAPPTHAAEPSAPAHAPLAPSQALAPFLPPAPSSAPGPAPAAGLAPPPDAARQGPPLLQLEAVTYRYPQTPQASPPALAGVDLRVGVGEFVAIVGGNGSGKSTLARLCNALLLPSEGHVRVAGLETTTPGGQVAARRRVGLVFQNPDNGIVTSVVEDDVAFGPENLGVPPEEIGRRVAVALATVGMTAEARRNPHHLSGGQKQRVAIAGVLAMHPDCLCLDEPTSQLDPAGAAEVLAVLRDLRRAGRTILLITHHLAEAVEADRVVLLDGGRVALAGTPSQVLTGAARLAAFGLQAPPAVTVWAALQRCGGLAGPVPLTIDDLATRLAAALRSTPDAHPERPCTEAPPSTAAPERAPRGATSRRPPLDRPQPPAHPRSVTPSPVPAGIDTPAAAVSPAATPGAAVWPAAPPAAAVSPAPAAPPAATRWPAAARRAAVHAARASQPEPRSEAPAPRTGVTLTGVRFTFPDPSLARRATPPAVADIDLRLTPGECVGLLGATGSGKTTVAQLCCGLLQPDAGALEVDGLCPWDLPRRARGRALAALRRRVGLVFQHPEDQFFEERVQDEVAFAPRNYGATPDQALVAARAALRTVGLPSTVDLCSPFHLSGGQMRRVALASTLAAHPAYLILDEPSAGLDAPGRAAVAHLVRGLTASGVGVLLVTHRMEEAALLADRLVVLRAGRIVAQGGTRAVFGLGAALADLGLESPPATALLSALAARGATLPSVALTLEEAIGAIAAQL